ncbi:hypothetical protein SAMN05421753_10397 [Planctomicrobium piriforme]|uniref:Uncharacterized protein n=2 Tax=Planctomicrobium piriforme TaxID=1576369 RepID=A0A1I3D584_9PLAN|nr:hypothetical protein SAMN05421753_10397 [Planctomicrobium piriforme]
MSMGPLFRSVLLLLFLTLASQECRAMSVFSVLSGNDVGADRAWPAGLAEALQEKPRVTGHKSHHLSFDGSPRVIELYYKGDSSEFNSLLKQLKEIGHPQTAVWIYPEPGIIQSRPLFPVTNPASYDWVVRVIQTDKSLSKQQPNLQREAEMKIVVGIHLGSELTLKSIQIPLEFDVECGDDIAQFVRRHQQLQIKSRTAPQDSEK